MERKEEKDEVKMKIFMERIIKSNIFSIEEQKRIKEDYLLYKKCYYLGILDKQSYIFH